MLCLLDILSQTSQHLGSQSIIHATVLQLESTIAISRLCCLSTGKSDSFRSTRLTMAGLLVRRHPCGDALIMEYQTLYNMCSAGYKRMCLAH